jgi:hypothetical protein
VSDFVDRRLGGKADETPPGRRPHMGASSLMWGTKASLSAFGRRGGQTAGRQAA